MQCTNSGEHVAAFIRATASNHEVSDIYAEGHHLRASDTGCYNAELVRFSLCCIYFSTGNNI